MSAVIELPLPELENGASVVDVLVIGAGPVGIHFINELLKRSPNSHIKVFGGEPWKPYNRVRLTDVLSGHASQGSLFQTDDISSLENIECHWNTSIVKVDNENKQVFDDNGVAYPYDKLVLALGSVPRVPNIKGNDLTNVFTFRNLKEAEALMGRQVSSRTTVIIGGGILGIEAAKAMQRFNTKVYCIEYSSRLMFNQLDDEASVYLENHLIDEDIQVRVNQRVVQIVADKHTLSKVTAIKLADGEVIPCDTVIISTGIIPNINLVRGSGIRVSRGINVNHDLETSVKDVYAIGECAEHNEKIYGLASPGFEQAAVLAENLSGGSAQYLGSVSVSQLKVLDYPVFSMGETDDNANAGDEYVYRDIQKGIYRKLIITNNRIRGVVALGDWPARHRIQEAIENKRYIWFWKPASFVSTGELWNSDDSDIANWPASAVVCNCMKVTRGDLSAAQAQGSHTIEALCTATGASSVCGSCRPLIQELTSDTAAPVAVEGAKPLWVASIIGILSALAFFFLPAMPYADSVQSNMAVFDQVWRTSLYKQISGFTLLGLSLVILLLSLRKRYEKFKWGSFPYWRVVHVVLGVLIFAVIFVHTGFRFGNELNFILMMTFSSLMVVGIFASTVIAQEHQLTQTFSTRIVSRIRKMSIWVHILIFWPVPALLAFHIIKGYYF